jgi:hypothetical protein
LAIVEPVFWKSVPRVSVPKYLVPVPPGVAGSAFPKNELAGWPDEALQEAAALLIS